MPIVSTLPMWGRLQHQVHVRSCPMLCLLCTIFCRFFVAYLLCVAPLGKQTRRPTPLMHPWQRQRAEERPSDGAWSQFLFLPSQFATVRIFCQSVRGFQIPAQKHTTHPCTFARFLACISLMICAFTNTGFPGATFSPSRYRTVVENFDCVFITCGGCLSTIRELKGLQT